MICTNLDDFLEDKTYWKAWLNDGRIVYGDDKRYGPEDVSWKRFKKFLAENPEIRIISLGARFRDHEVILPLEDGIDGFYFSFGTGAILNTNIVRSHYVLGYIKNNIIRKFRYKIPELEIEFVEDDILDINKEGVILHVPEISKDL